MASLIQHITATGAAGYGVNILETAPPSAILGAASTVLGVVLECPWGPEVLTDVTSSAQLFEAFAPAEFGNVDAYAGMKAFLGKQLPALQISRVLGSGAAASTLTLNDAGATPSVTFTAKYKGVSGDKISILLTPNVNALFMDMTITVGSYSKKYLKVVEDAAGTIIVHDPKDRFGTLTLAAGAVALPSVGTTTPLAGGSDGTIVAADYTGSASVNVGIRRFYSASAKAGVVIVAEAPTAVLDACNAALVTLTSDLQGAMVVLSTPASQTLAAAKAYVAAYRSDFAVATYPRVVVTNSYDPALAVVTIDGNVHMAVNMLGHDAWLSPGGKSSARFYAQILDLENTTLTKTDYDALNAEGIAPFFPSDELGIITHRAVTTNLTSGLTKIFRRRMTTYLQDAIAKQGEHYAEEPLDLNLTSRTLGVVTGSLVGEINAFLEGLKGLSRIQSYAVDAFSLNTQSNIDAGTWNIQVAVKLFSSQDVIIFTTNIGETVAV